MSDIRPAITRAMQSITKKAGDIGSRQDSWLDDVVTIWRKLGEKGPSDKEVKALFEAHEAEFPTKQLRNNAAAVSTYRVTSQWQAIKDAAETGREEAAAKFGKDGVKTLRDTQLAVVRRMNAKKLSAVPTVGLIASDIAPKAQNTPKARDDIYTALATTLHGTLKKQLAAHGDENAEDYRKQLDTLAANLGTNVGKASMIKSFELMLRAHGGLSAMLGLVPVTVASDEEEEEGEENLLANFLSR